MKGDFEVPRDRQASFEPKLVAKGQTRFAGFDDKILSLYARGMTTREIQGLWTSANEGAKFWLQVLTEMQNRGLKDIFIACVDGLKGFPQAIETVYPKTTVVAAATASCTWCGPA